MSGFLDNFRKKVITSVFKDVDDKPEVIGIDDKIALGVLLWIVAEADGKFLPQENEKIKEILGAHCQISPKDMPLLIKTIEIAAKERVDLFSFTHEIGKDLPYNKKISIIETLFRLAYVDRDLDLEELELIRKISGLFYLTHKDFIDAKIRIKEELSI
tara:strand:- start:301 stop:774 length:474 start_codon:yes stop_codon:yes gene_type:complete